MNYKTCKVLNDNFRLDEKYNIFLNAKNVQVTDGLEKGYIYSAMFFYDEVEKEIRKLDKIVRKQLDMILLENPNIDTPIMFLDLSRRVQQTIGDDSLEALAKQVLGETKTHIALIPEPEETRKLDEIKESILAETLTNLFDTVIKNSEKTDNDFKKAVLAQAYIEKLTERQKKLLSPAIKMIGFINDIRLDSFEIKDDVATFQLFKMAAPFKSKEESIKKSLKKLMDDNL